MIEKSCTNCALDLVACFSDRIEACEQWRPDNTVKRDIEIKESYKQIYDAWKAGCIVLTDGEKEEMKKIVGIDLSLD